MDKGLSEPDVGEDHFKGKGWIKDAGLDAGLIKGRIDCRADEPPKALGEDAGRCRPFILKEGAVARFKDCEIGATVYFCYRGRQ
ncbi:MAG: hypothetical protein K0S07_448 [Chlamydiales bacterium]|nr:hypothetical protein [Chlamydiales bacterium]